MMVGKTRFVILGFAGIVLLVSLPAAAQSIKTGQGGAGYRYVNPMGRSLQWLYSPQVQKELELVDQQQEKIRKIREEAAKKMRELWSGLDAKDPQQRAALYREKSAKLAQETEEQVQKVLLPHQSERLKQITLQMQLRGYGTARALTGEEIAKRLGISDKQKARLLEAQTKAQKELQEKLQKLYREVYDEAREKVLRELTPQQRKKLDALMGEKFDWQRGAAGTTQKK